MRCLVQFSQEFHWINFRFAELDSLLLINGIDPLTAYTRADSNDGTLDAFLCIELPGLDVAKAICDRSILIKGIYELWTHSSSLTGLISNAKSLPTSFLESYMTADKTWSISVDSHCKSYSMSDKEKCRNKFRFLDFKGAVNLDDANVQLWILLDYSQYQNSTEVNIIDIIVIFSLSSILYTLLLITSFYQFFVPYLR